MLHFKKQERLSLLGRKFVERLQEQLSIEQGGEELIARRELSTEREVSAQRSSPAGVFAVGERVDPGGEGITALEGPKDALHSQERLLS